jgi:hypothetical protein
MRRVGTRRTQNLDDLRKRNKILAPKGGIEEQEKCGKDNLKLSSLVVIRNVKEKQEETILTELFLINYHLSM